MGNTNKQLRSAAKAKNDEFYTQLSDIENEMRHYRDHFKGKVVYCNCDDPRISNFFYYFSYNFKRLGLKKLITTCYKSTNPNLFSEHKEENGLSLEYDGNKDTSRIPDPDEIEIEILESDGDFRSDECIKLLKKSDIVCTNPPFSLFNEYVEQLIKYDKKFLILGDQNALTYKEIFSHIKDSKLWSGYYNGGTKWFQVPMDYDIKTESRKKIENGVKYFSMGRIYWFTNLDIAKRHEDIILYKKYTQEEYPYYDNYNAINVDKVKDIPSDYDGYMGVPITFLDKYNPSQFELLGIMNTGEENIGIRYENTPHGRPLVNGVEKYLRILIRNRKL